MMKYKGAFIKLFPLMLKKHMIEQYGKDAIIILKDVLSKLLQERTDIWKYFPSVVT